MMKSLSKVYQYLSFICLLIQFLFSIYFYNQSGVFFDEGVLILFQSLTGLLVIGIVQRSNKQHDFGICSQLVLLMMGWSILQLLMQLGRMFCVKRVTT